MKGVDRPLTAKKLSQLAKRIRQAREGSHLSQSELAKNLGVSDKSISAYEQGRSTPSLEKLKKIASSTHRSLEYFTNDDVTKAEIATKLQMIERELAAVKKLLLKKPWPLDRLDKTLI